MPNFVLLSIHLKNIYKIPTECQALLKGSKDIEMSKNDVVPAICSCKEETLMVKQGFFNPIFP